MQISHFVFMACILLGACATNNKRDLALRHHTPLQGVSFSLPSGFREVPAQGVDSAFARLESGDVVITLDQGRHGAQPPQVARIDSSFTAASGQIFDWFHVSNAMEGFPHGIIGVERRSQERLGNATIDPVRLSIGVHCRKESHCADTAAAIEKTLRIEL